MRRRDLIRLGFAGAAYAAVPSISSVLARPAAAQITPGRPIKMIVPFVAGGATDAIGRILGQRLSDLLATPVVIDNRAGANGNIGAEAVARAEPDGHTLLLATAGVYAVNPSLYPGLSFSATRDLAPISGVYDTGNVLLVRKNLPVGTVTELVELAKTQPGRLTFASGGVGSSSHMFGELFQQATGVRLQHVPYRSNGPALNDLLAGIVDVFFDQIPSGAAQAQAGNVRALAVTTTKRSIALPDVPTFREARFEDVTGTFWVAMTAPSRTPPEVVARLNDAIRTVLGEAAIRDRFASLGADPMPTTPEELRKLIVSDGERWKKVVETGRLQP